MITRHPFLTARGAKFSARRPKCLISSRQMPATWVGICLISSRQMPRFWRQKIKINAKNLETSTPRANEHRKVDCRIIRSIECTHSASRNTTQPVVSGKFEGEVNILSTRLAWTGPYKPQIQPFGGRFPCSQTLLVSLDGVGRKNFDCSEASRAHAPTFQLVGGYREANRVASGSTPRFGLSPR